MSLPTPLALRPARAQPEGMNPYAIPLAALEKSVQVPVDQQVSSQPEPPAEGPLAPEDLDRLRLLGVLSAGVL